MASVEGLAAPAVAGASATRQVPCSMYVQSIANSWYRYVNTPCWRRRLYPKLHLQGHSKGSHLMIYMTTTLGTAVGLPIVRLVHVRRIFIFF